MDALHKVLHKIHAEPAHPASAALKSLVESLDRGLQFDLASLYSLNYSDFGLALDLMRQWRLDSFRYERGWASKVASDTEELAKAPSWMNPATVGPLYS
jgi:hypothetical protein